MEMMERRGRRYKQLLDDLKEKRGYCQLRRPRELSRYSDSLQAGRSRDRIPVGARFSAPVQTGPGVYPASCTMVTGSFPGGKAAGAWC